LGISQLGRADDGLQRRRQIAARYAKELAGLRNIRLSKNDEGHAYHLYVIECDDRLGLYNWLKKNGIFAQVHYVPTHLMPYYGEHGWKEGDMAHAEDYYRKCLSLPMYPSLTDEEHSRVISAIVSFSNR
jgi:dTDP-4-amino-4,6-dideoxygalactose transaminase